VTLKWRLYSKFPLKPLFIISWKNFVGQKFEVSDQLFWKPLFIITFAGWKVQLCGNTFLTRRFRSDTLYFSDSFLLFRLISQKMDSAEMPIPPSSSSSNFSAVDFVWMNPSLPQRSCSAQAKEVEVGTSFYMIDIPCIIEKHPAWFQLSLISAFVTHISLSSSKWTCW